MAWATPETTAAGQASPADSSRIRFLALEESSGYTGQPLRHEVRAELLNLGYNECRKAMVTFVPLTGHDADISKVFAQPESSTPLGGCRCIAKYRWRLSDAPGAQALEVRYTMPTPPFPASAGKTDTSVAEWVAHTRDDLSGTTWIDRTSVIADAPPSLVVGLAYLPGGVGHVPGPDSTTKKEKRSIQPTVGVEFAFSTLLFPVWGPLDHSRFLLATSFGDPGRDLYVGSEIAPLPFLAGAKAAAIPLQLTFGYKIGIQSGGNAFLMAHYNASSALSTIFTGIGAK